MGSWCQIGTGNTPPNIADNSMESYLGKSEYGTWVTGTPLIVGTVLERFSTAEFQFTVGTIVGNISELGISTEQYSSAGLQTRALFKDTGGNPVTIAVTADDQLIITYSIHKHISLVPVSSSIDVGGSTINYTIEPCVVPGIYLGKPDSVLHLVNSSYNLFPYKEIAYNVNPTTYAPEASGADTTYGTGEPSLTTTGVLSGATVTTTHLTTYSSDIGNVGGDGVIKQLIATSTSFSTSSPLSFGMFVLTFTGPNYITKTSDDLMDVSILETVVQS